MLPLLLLLMRLLLLVAPGISGGNLCPLHRKRAGCRKAVAGRVQLTVSHSTGQEVRVGPKGGGKGGARGLTLHARRSLAAIVLFSPVW
jgi:hypothetical protein